MKKIRYFIVSTIVLCMIFASTIVTYAADPYLSFGSKTGNVNVKKYADKYNDSYGRHIRRYREVLQGSNARSCRNAGDSHSLRCMSARRYRGL